ncbi:MAG TPA: nitronate monooxygenase [Actinomycetes bacterium]|nr:nitronate monooxygenase [Actinomycetes bacterium]
MLTTRLCDLLGITHPVVLGGMALGTNPDLVAAVSDAGGLGTLGGCADRSPESIAELAAGIRELTDAPFGMNLLLFRVDETDERPTSPLQAVLRTRPAVLATAWARADQDLSPVFADAHEAGCLVMHMVSTVAEADRAVAAGADVIVAQGSEGGGHVGLVGTIALVPMVARAVAPVPVVAAGGLADGAGLAAALMLGAEGALFGTRFLATVEASVPDSYKQAIVESDGHHTVLTELPDVAAATVWPGAYARVERNHFIDSWLGREGELRLRQREVGDQVWAALRRGDMSGAPVYLGQSAGLVTAVEPAARVVERIVAEATERLHRRAFAADGPVPD